MSVYLHWTVQKVLTSAASSSRTLANGAALREWCHQPREQSAATVRSECPQAFCSQPTQRLAGRGSKSCKRVCPSVLTVAKRSACTVHPGSASMQFYAWMSSWVASRVTMHRTPRQLFVFSSISCRPKLSRLQCFDLDNFIDSNRRVPAWKCPVCSGTIVYQELRIDRIIANVSVSPLMPRHRQSAAYRLRGGLF